jgi:hypothetical protein
VYLQHGQLVLLAASERQKPCALHPGSVQLCRWLL